MIHDRTGSISRCFTSWHSEDGKQNQAEFRADENALNVHKKCLDESSDWR